MTKVIYVPLDERACNYYFPQQLAAMTEGIEMLVPPYEDMGFLKNLPIAIKFGIGFLRIFPNAIMRYFLWILWFMGIL